MTKAQELKALANYKELFDLYLRRPMNAEEQQIFNDCIDCKISFEEYKEKLMQLIIEKGKKLTNLFSDNDEITKKKASAS
jgi:hypothetical protein